MSNEIKCANDDCEQSGKHKCSACAMVSYCGQSCQKAHWNSHKGFCKANRRVSPKTPSSSSNISPQHVRPVQSPNQQQINIDPAIMNRLQVCKAKTQQSFIHGDYLTSCKHGIEALKVAKELAEPVQSVESIQILLNMSTAYLNLGKIKEADEKSAQAIEIGEKAVILRQNHPQAIDMLAATLSNRTYVLLNANRLDEAESIGRRALKLVESIFPPHDPRFFKTFRGLGLVLARRDKIEESEGLLKQAYEVSAGVNGPCNNDSQLVLDDLVPILIKRHNGSTAEAEKLLKQNFTAMEDSCTEEFNSLVGEAAAKLGSLLASQGKDKECETYLLKALKIRQKTMPANSHVIAMTMMAIANIRENQGDVSEETERYLVHALEIFRSVSTTAAAAGSSNDDTSNDDEGQNSTHILNAIAFIRRIRTKRQGSQQQAFGAHETADELDDDLSELNQQTKQKASAAAALNSASANALAKKVAEVINKRDLDTPYVSPTVDLDANDGITRMKMSAYFFETAQYSKAEIVLQEAFDIFLRQHGPQHPNTLTAKQNLEIVKQNALNQLWHEVMLEEKQKLMEVTNMMQSLSVNGNATSTPVTADAVTPAASKAQPQPSSGGGEWGEINTKAWEVEAAKPISQCVMC